MKANKLQIIWIMLRSGLEMARICFSIIYFSFVGKLPRDKANQIARDWANRILKIIKLTYTVHNPHNIDFNQYNPCIVMTNHSSLYDIPISFAALPGSIRMIGKKELFRIPIFGHAMHKGEILCIDRYNRPQAIKDLQLARDKIKSGLILWIAPEGTRSPDGKLLPLKKGGFIMAIDAKAYIIPVRIEGAHKILPKKTWQFHLNQHVDIHIGQPIDASQYTLDNKKALMELVKEQLGGVGVKT